MEHVVLLSSVGAQLSDGTGPIRAVQYGEQQLRAAMRNVTALRPCYFMENWAIGLGMVRGQGVLPTFIAPQARIPMISTGDIGRVAADRLMAGGPGHVIVELCRPGGVQSGAGRGEFGRILGVRSAHTGCAAQCRGADHDVVRFFRRGGTIV